MREFVRAVQDLRKEKGFEAKDRAVLSIFSDESFKKIVSRFESEIKKIAGLDAVKNPRKPWVLIINLIVSGMVNLLFW